MENYTTWEKLMENLSGYGAILEYKGHILKVDMNWQEEYVAQIYAFDYKEEDDELSKIEQKLKIMEQSDTQFEDSGSAMLWCYERLQ